MCLLPFDFEIAFDGDKFIFVMTDPTNADNYTPSSRRTIAVSDGSATLVRGLSFKQGELP
jgi:hypothetical protein